MLRVDALICCRLLMLALLFLPLAASAGQAADDLNPVTLHKAPQHAPVLLVEQGTAAGRHLRDGEETGRYVAAGDR